MSYFYADGACPGDHGVEVFLEQKHQNFFSPFCRRDCELKRDARFPRPRRAEQKRARASMEASADKIIQLWDTRLYDVTNIFSFLIRRDQPRKHSYPSALNQCIVK